MALTPSEDIRSITDLKRKTKEILNHLHRTQRPVVLTVNGRDNAVIMDTKTYERHVQAGNMARLLAPAERDIESVWSFIAESFIANSRSKLIL